LELCQTGVQGLAVLLEHNNAFNVSRAFAGESLAHDPKAHSLGGVWCAGPR
jgi:hypothetical protein